MARGQEETMMSDIIVQPTHSGNVYVNVVKMYLQLSTPGILAYGNVFRSFFTFVTDAATSLCGVSGKTLATKKKAY
ncbi:hypothetical protein NUW54_g171 [Trametes sanguinea]|uniref:Uncharacterized protein n=2 Tax=Trametes sanguinea TaxID=158606 RepID=A0ACC1Q7P5_9APHY|nr:hypothetical protein NUW54_g978 [Trametes sanguinea]KAJ3019105.1 hypothetical protein NUW54_g171 [Trametes sanguinea]